MSQDEMDEKNVEEEVVTKKKTSKKRKLSKKKLSILGIVLLVVIILIFLFYFLLVPKISLIGDKLIKVEYGEPFKDPGVKATCMGQNISDKAWTEGSIDENHLGVYHLKYKVRKNRMTVTTERDVEIVDSKKPTITLEGEKEIKLCPSKKYEEEGFSAVDNYDGDLTDKVETVENDDKIEYIVKDSSGNKETVNRILNREDTEAPTITLNSGDTYYVTINNTFKDPGYKVVDNCDEDLSDKVTVEGTVDTSKLGTYTLKYTVKDTKENIATKERKVVVQEKVVKNTSSASLGCGKAGVIYLTFDDGPNGTYTAKILDVLKKYNVKATFFVTSAGPDSMIKREADEGHTIALHSSTHEYSIIYKSKEAFWADMDKVQARVERITGKKSYLMRFPGGSSNTVSRKYKSGIMSELSIDVENKGYAYFDWNISSGDAGGLKSSTFDGKVQEEINNVKRSLSKSRGNVILMHDIKQTTASAIEEIVKYGINNGYTFGVLDKSIICHQRINN